MGGSIAIGFFCFPAFAVICCIEFVFIIAFQLLVTVIIKFIHVIGFTGMALRRTAIVSLAILWRLSFRCFNWCAHNFKDLIWLIE